MMYQDHLRILRGAEHWARSYSNEFAAHVAECRTPPVPTTTALGDLGLLGSTLSGGVVSICLAQTDLGPELHLMRAEHQRDKTQSIICVTEVHLTLPRYLARQLTQPEATP